MDKKKKIFCIVDILLILLITGLTVRDLLKENPMEKLKAMIDLGILGVVVVLIMYLLVALLEGYLIKYIFKFSKTKISYLDSIGAYMCGSLFSNITPLKIGNMPSLMYYYSKCDIEMDKGVSCFVESNFIFSIHMILICLFSAIFCYLKGLAINVGGINIELGLVALIGLIYNIIMGVGCLIIAYNKFLQKWFIKLCAAFLHKFKRISDKNKYCLDMENRLKLYRDAISMFLKNLKNFIFILILDILKSFIWGTIPYVIYAFLTKQFYVQDLLLSFIIYQLIGYISNIVPIPGASGAIEYSFVALYAMLFNQNYLVSTVLIWRVITYFIPIILGFVCFLKKFNKKKVVINE